MGQREIFSAKDISKINAMYKCNGNTAASGYILTDALMDQASDPGSKLANIMSSLFKLTNDGEEVEDTNSVDNENIEENIIEEDLEDIPLNDWYHIGDDEEYIS